MRFLVLFYLLCWLHQPLLLAQPNWKTLEEGLQLATLEAPVKSKYGDSKITVLRIDPARFAFELESATEKQNNGITLPLNEWCKKRQWIAGINAGMFDGYDPTQPDYVYRVNRGYMQDYDHINSSQVTRDKAVICFNPKSDKLPAFQIVDIELCTNLATLKQQYHTLVQGIRMINCKQKNTWFIDRKIWSVCLMGMDSEGKALFIHCRSPYTMYQFINMLQQLPLQLQTLIYLEGGPEASFYLSHGDTQLQKMGSYETGFNLNDNNKEYWKLANVIGIRKK